MSEGAVKRDVSNEIYEKMFDIWKNNGLDPENGKIELSEEEKSEVACWVTIEEIRSETCEDFIKFYEDNRKFPIDCHSYLSIYTRISPSLCLIAKLHGEIIGEIILIFWL